MNLLFLSILVQTASDAHAFPQAFKPTTLSIKGDNKNKDSKKSKPAPQNKKAIPKSKTARPKAGKSLQKIPKKASTPKELKPRTVVIPKHGELKKITPPLKPVPERIDEIRTEPERIPIPVRTGPRIPRDPNRLLLPTTQPPNTASMTLWGIRLGLIHSRHSIEENNQMSLTDGVIAYEDGTLLYQYEIPLKSAFDETDLYGIQIGTGLVHEQFFFDMNFQLELMPDSQKLYHWESNSGASHPLVVYHSSFDVSINSGLMIKTGIFRPMLGMSLGILGYQGNIIEQSSSSAWIEEGAIPYYLISTSFDDEGNPQTPELISTTLYTGPVWGLRILLPGSPVQFEISQTNKWSTAGRVTTSGLSFLYVY